MTGGPPPKFNPQRGRMPVLQFCRPAELRIDPAYQRDIANSASQTLIRRIAQNWDWTLCQPLAVARRKDIVERLFVIDGQHRLAAARLRGDIDQLPCVVVEYARVDDEAKSFVTVNRSRKPLGPLDLFRAAVAAGEVEAVAVSEAIADAGLSLAPHGNSTAWKPGMVSNTAGMRAAWREHGPETTTLAMKVLAQAFPGERLYCAGTIFPGIVAICAREKVVAGPRFDTLCKFLRSRTQNDWRLAVTRMRAAERMSAPVAAARVLLGEWEKFALGSVPPTSTPSAPRVASAASAAPRVRIVPTSAEPPARLSPPACAAAPITVAQATASDGKRWCDQCEKRVHLSAATLCKSRYCKLRPQLGARA